MSMPSDQAVPPERVDVDPPPALLHAGEVTIDLARARIYARGVMLSLTRQQFLILKTLATRPGELVTHETLFQSVWGYETLGDHRALDSAMYRLRRRFLEVDVELPIETVPGLGYILTAETAAPVESGSLFEWTFRSAATGLLLLGRDLRILAANDSASELLGYSTDELASLTSAETLVSRDAVDRLRGFVDKTFAGQPAVTVLRLADREWAAGPSDIAASGRVIRDEDGEVRAILVELGAGPESDRPRPDRDLTACQN